MTRFSLLSLPLLWLACSDSEQRPSPDSGTPAPDLARLDLSPADARAAVTLPPAGGAGHADVDATLDAGQARAGRVTADSQLLGGIKVEGRVGDFKIYNNRVAFIIEDARGSNGVIPFGGELVDAMSLEPRRASSWGEIALSVGTGVVSPSSVGVVADGSDGEAAVVRVIGKPALVPYLETIGAALGGAPPVVLVQDYVLEPDSQRLEIRWRVLNDSDKALDVPLTGMGLAAGDGLSYFVEGTGFSGQPEGDREHLIFAAEPPRDGETPMAGYLLRSASTWAPLIEREGLMLLTGEGVKIPPRGEVVRTLTLSLTTGEPEAALRELRRLDGVAEPPALSGVVKGSGGGPVAGARIHVLQPGSKAGAEKVYVTRTRADATGRYSVGLAPGDYLLRASASGHGPSALVPVTVAAAPATSDLTLGGTATLRYSVKDKAGRPLPAKLIFEAPGVERLPSRYGEPTYPDKAVLVAAVHGDGELALPPGSYSATASRGFEYELGTTTFELTAGAVEQVSFVLERSVDSSGLVSGDFHIHAMWSLDSSDRSRDKVAWLAAEGVELPVLTEHDYVGDLNPIVVELGLQQWVHSISGDEITPLGHGHFNVYPLVPDPSRRNNGAFEWAGRSPNEIFSDVRAAVPDSVLQVNHPRSLVSGYLEAWGYDPVTGQPRQAAGWSLDFDALEVFNAKRLPNEDWTASIGEWLGDWFSLLDRGKRLCATGNSDSHDVLKTEVGYPRNLVAVGGDEPANVTGPVLAAAVKAQRAQISGGPLISASIAGKSLGQLAPVTAGQAELALTVQAPSWIAVDTLRVYVGGVEAKVIKIEPSMADPANPALRYQEKLTILAPADTYVVVAVTGSQPLTPVVPGGYPFAVTNPIYLDADGNGRFDPPKSF